MAALVCINLTLYQTKYSCFSCSINFSHEYPNFVDFSMRIKAFYLPLVTKCHLNTKMIEKNSEKSLSGASSEAQHLQLRLKVLIELFTLRLVRKTFQLFSSSIMKQRCFRRSTSFCREFLFCDVINRRNYVTMTTYRLHHYRG